ncbi:hypothetical protein Gbth_007_046 [Gluconobacter thailandicus F149-1 = NBRC 100600]|nr:hypothetical protein Gbth_007_046 [Gluconobacter thailandicus F149-1 = NBRC 100600]GBR59848.1 hypothetical protein AA100600_1521 [Gluconobacter thailandicus F149-1 = NBRC 100600]GEL86250.1 hypothetical protein GTH01_06080 [Gluconobacter thailandicus F149-1 = NBRC 100600]
MSDYNSVKSDNNSFLFIKKINNISFDDKINLEKVSRIFDVHLQCRENSCGVKIYRNKNIPVSNVNFRFGNTSYILILDVLKGVYISPDMLRGQFGHGKLSLGCTDGVFCPYVSFEGRWRHIAFPMPDQDHDQNCVKKIIINSNL